MKTWRAGNTSDPSDIETTVKRLKLSIRAVIKGVLKSLGKSRVHVLVAKYTVYGFFPIL